MTQTCLACGHENRETARFCEACAVPLQRVCAGCGSALRPAAKFCDACGAAVAGTTPDVAAGFKPASGRAEPGAREHAGLRPAATSGSRPPTAYTPKHLAEKILNSRAALVGERKIGDDLRMDYTAQGHTVGLAQRMGVTLYWQGELSAAREPLQQAFNFGGPLRQRLGTWFTDTSAGGLRSAGDFETRDRRAAKVLLDELSQGR